MTRRIVRTKPAPASVPPVSPPVVKLTPMQKEVVRLLRRGWRIMRGQTGVRHSVTGSSTYEWGEMLCPPGAESGRLINMRVLDALIKKGFVEVVPRAEPTPKFENFADLIHWQNRPRETHRLATKEREATK